MMNIMPLAHPAPVLLGRDGPVRFKAGRAEVVPGRTLRPEWPLRTEGRRSPLDGELMLALRTVAMTAGPTGRKAARRARAPFDLGSARGSDAP